MKRKQIYSLLLAASLTGCMVSQSVYSEEGTDDVAAEAVLEEEPVQEEALPEQSAETGNTENTQTEGDTSEASEETETAAPETPAENTPEAQAVPSEAPAEDQQVAGNVVTSEEELNAAIAATPAGEMRTLVLNNSFSVSSTVTIPAGVKIALIASTGSVTISRGAGFGGDVFRVDGLLTFQSQEITSIGDSGSITIDGSGAAADGSLIHISDGGIFGMDGSLSLVNNTTSGNGGAIYNAASGSLIISGGTITGNTAAAGGGIYTETSIMVSGNVNISGNSGTDGSMDNVAIASATDAIIVGGLLYDAMIGVNVPGAEEGSYVIFMSEDAVAQGSTIGETSQYFSSDNPGYIISPDGTLIDPANVPDEPVHSEAYPEEVGEGEDTAQTEASEEGEDAGTDAENEENDTQEKSAPTLKRLTDVVWVDANTITTQCVTNCDGVYYAAVMPVSEGVPEFDLNASGIPVTADVPFDVLISGINVEEDAALYVLVKSADNQLSPKGAVPLDLSARPGAAEDELTAEAAAEEAVPSDTPAPGQAKTDTAKEEQAGTDTPEEEQVQDSAGEAETAVAEKAEAVKKAVSLKAAAVNEAAAAEETAEEQEGTETAGETDELGTEEAPAEEVTMKESKVEDSKITGIEDGGTYTVSADAPINVTIVGANSFGENPAQVGDTRWLFQSVSINGGTATAKWEWTGEDAPVYTISLVPSDSIRESGDYDITFYFIQEVLEPNKWTMTEADLGEVTLRVHLDVPAAVVTETPVPTITQAPTETPVPTVTPVVTETPADVTVTPEAVSPTPTPGDGSLDPDVTITPSRAPKIADISDTVVSGITNLKLMPNTFYPFSVTGAGSDNYDPVSGDTRWVPAYWRMESGTTQQTTWRIGAKAGINEVRTIPIRVYLQEQRYDGTEWKATGVTDYISANVTTATYGQSDINGTTTDSEGNVIYQNGKSYSAGDADSGSDSTSSTSKSGSTSDIGSGTAKNAATGDTSPVGTFGGLAGVSLLTAAAALLKKRKKNI